MTFVRIIAALAGVISVGILLAWTPAESTDSRGKTVVRYWVMVGPEESDSQAIRSFHEQQDQILVEPMSIPWTEHEKKILTAVLSGHPPDVISQFAPVVQWASRMALQPLDKYIESSNLDISTFFPALMEEMQWQGHTFALPVSTASYALFYNKELFREAGLDPERPPATWDDVIAISQRIRRYDDEGKLVRAGFLPSFSPIQNVVLGNAGASQLMAWQLGADYLADDGVTVQLATPAVAEAFEWTCRYYDDYDLYTVASFIGGLGTKDQHGFITGKLAMAVLDLSFLAEIKKYRPDLDFGVATTPVFPGGQSASIAGSWWLGIPRGASNPDEAWQFIHHCVQASTMVQEALSRDDTLFPANRLAAADPRFKDSPHVDVFIEQMEHSYSPVVVPLAHSVFWREFYGALERAVTGTQSVQEALEQAERIVQQANTSAFEYDSFVRSRMSFE